MNTNLGLGRSKRGLSLSSSRNVTTRSFKEGPIERMTKKTGTLSRRGGVNNQEDDVVLSESVSLRNGTKISRGYFDSGVTLTGLLGSSGPVVLDAMLGLDLDSGEFSLRRHQGVSQTVRSDGSQTLRSVSPWVLDCESDGSLQAVHVSEEDHFGGCLNSPIYATTEAAVAELDDGSFAFSIALQDGKLPSAARRYSPYLTREELNLSQSERISGPTRPQAPRFTSVVDEPLVKRDGRWIEARSITDSELD